ncbi:MAG: membrane protein [Candidatus Azotimanducaceae bacterium]|jgi:membrane protein|tara:strand:- start:183 stop:1427 length:1245 start_codon:yes stop_codon:yes gene_type:complete
MSKNDASDNRQLISPRLGQRFFPAALQHLSLLGQQLIRYDCLTSAAALTYTTLFAVVPLMTVTLLFFSLLPEFAVLGQDFQNFLFQNFLPAGSTLVQEKLLEFADRATTLTAAGVIGLLITSLLMLVAVEKQFNNIWQVEAPRWSLHRVLVYWGILSLGPVAIVSAMLVSAYLLSIPLISDLETWTLGKTLLTYLPVLLTALGFTALYVVVPNCKVSVLHGFYGGVATAIIFKIAFFLYTEASKNFFYDAIYGAFAALPIFLIWLYLVWVIVLAGAVFVRSIAMGSMDLASSEPTIVKALRLLNLVRLAHVRGEGVDEGRLRAAGHFAANQWRDVVSALQRLNLIKLDEDQRWRLGRDLKTVTLWQLVQIFPEHVTKESLSASSDFPALERSLLSLVEYGEAHLSLSLDEIFTD